MTGRSLALVFIFGLFLIAGSALAQPVPTVNAPTPTSLQRGESTSEKWLRGPRTRTDVPSSRLLWT